MKQFSLKALGLVALLFAFGWVSAQKTETTTPSTNPLEHLSADPAGYDAAKAEWVGTHPKEYEALTQGNERQAEAVTMPWGAPENKDKWISEHPREYAEMQNATQDTRVRMTKAQLATFPAEKQAAILRDSNFVIEE